jgi:uncharacterized membrane protein
MSDRVEDAGRGIVARRNRNSEREDGSGRINDRVFIVVIPIVLGALLFVLRPDLILTDTTPTGGDTGAHVFTGKYVREILLPNWRLSGWSQEWFAGFPMMHFYFPLSFLIQAVVSTIVPFEIAFKVIMVLPILLLPVAVLLCFRLLRFREPIPSFGSTASFGFLLMSNSDVTGGNILSTVNGEFSYALGLGLLVIAIGLGHRVAMDPKPPLRSSVVVMTTLGLSHLLHMLIAVMLTPIPFLLCTRRFGAREAVKRFAGVLGISFSLGAFWFVPFLARLGAVPPIEPIHVTGWAQAFPDELDVFLVLMACAACIAFVHREKRFLDLVFPGLVCLLLFRVFRTSFFWNARLLPLWYLSVFLTAGYLLGHSVSWILYRWRTPRSFIRTALVITLVVCGVSSFLVVRSDEVASAVATSLGGYERSQRFSNFKQLMVEIDHLRQGRFLSEWSDELDEELGSHHAFMSIPYWTDQHSIEGMYYESSLTFPFTYITRSEASYRSPKVNTSVDPEAFDLDDALAHMRILGVSYYLTVSDEARRSGATTPGLSLVAEAGPYSVFGTGLSQIVEIPRYLPVRWRGDDWRSATEEWFRDASMLEVPLAEYGPDDWPAISSFEKGIPKIPTEDRGKPSQVSVDHDRIEFRASAVGVPHIVRVSFFPNWRAYGALGPYPISPSMMVVVPTQNQVRIAYDRTWAEWVGIGITVWVVVTLSVRFLWRRTRRS